MNLDVSVAMQQQVPVTQQVQTTIETSQLQFSDGFVDVPVASLKQIPTIQRSHKPVNVPQVRTDRSVVVPVATQRQVPTVWQRQAPTMCLEPLVDVPVVTQQTVEIPL